ncbi:hypothetical protein ASF58_19615 [Methylobacterium sp. Leaf125]|nr:hypothetical protein ASF58_19615 [Methylobacterium sp. Leaf125]
MLAKGTTFRTVELMSYEVGSDGAPRLVSQDVFKLAAAQQDDINLLTGNHTVALAYGSHVESVPTYDFKGLQNGTATAGWNAIRNIADNSLTQGGADGSATSVKLGLPVYDPSTGLATSAGVVNAQSDGERKLFLHIRNADGSPLLGLGDKWIELNDADLSFVQTINFSSQSSGAGAGKVAFDPLSLSFDPGALSPVLQQILAQGKALQVEIAAYGRSATVLGGPLLDVYQFGLAAFEKSAAKYDGDQLIQTYSLRYGSERITHSIVDPNTGDPTGRTIVTGWDRVRNIEISKDVEISKDAQIGIVRAPSTATEAVVKAYTAVSDADHYYLRFTGYDGAVLKGDDGAAQWFEVADFSFGAGQMLNIGSQSAGAGAGKVTFEGLTFTLGSSKATSALDTMLAKGTPFRTVELVGYGKDKAGVPNLISQDVFKFAAVQSDGIDASTGQHAFNLAYGGHVESVTVFGRDGMPNGTATAGWDSTNNRADDSLSHVVGGKGGDVALGPPLYDPNTGNLSAGGAVPSSSVYSDLHHYLQIRNADGRDFGGFSDKWINITDADLAFLQALNLGSASTGVGAGKVAFEPLTMNFGAGAGALAPYLFQAQAKGTTFQLELATYGRFGNSDQAVLVDDYQFGLAALKTINQHQGDEGLEYSYTFDYGTQRITHALIDDKSGKIIGSSVSGWDRTTNTAMVSDGVASSGKAVGPIRAPAQNPDEGSLIAGGVGKDLYVRFTGYDGNILKGDNGTAQWFEVSGVDFGSDQSLSIGSQSTGAGAGKISFSPLSFALASSAGATQLDAFLAKGTPFKTVELVSYGSSPNKGAPQAVSLFTFKLAAVKSDVIDVVTGLHKLNFDYGGLVSKAVSVNADGSFSNDVSLGWNGIKNISDNSLTNVDPLPTKAAFTTQVTSASTGGISIRNPPEFGSGNGVEHGASIGDRDVYVQIRNADGTLLKNLGEKWIKVASADLSFEQTLNLSSQSGGAGAGKVMFNPLSLSFDAGALGPGFDQALAQGKGFQIEIATYKYVGNGEHVRLDDHQFGGAVLKESRTSVDVYGARHVYSFDYDTQRATHSLLSPNGHLKETSVEGWDRTTNTELLVDVNKSGHGVGPIHAPTEAEGLVFYNGSGDVTPTPSNTLLGTFSDDILTAPTVADWTLDGLDGNDTLIGNNGADTLHGGAGIDILAGARGNDMLDGGVGADRMYGGIGNDTFVVDNTGDIVIEYSSEGTDTVLASVSHALSVNVENLTLIGTDAINGTGNNLANILTGNAASNVLSGGYGDDQLFGLGGNDTLNGGVGNDTMVGGTGDDTYIVDAHGDVVIEAAGEGTDTVLSSVGYELGANVENLTLIGEADLKGIGNDLDNVLIGNASDNQLFGGAGNDHLDGGRGADKMFGGTGDDTYVVDNAGDIVVEYSGQGTDTVEASVSYILDGGVENLILTGTSSLDGTGNALANVLTGNAGDNHLSGGAGNDTLYGGAGNDTLDGGTGFDTFYGGTGDDTYIVDGSTERVFEFANEGTDTVLASVTFKLQANLENLTLTGTGAINGTGNFQSNILIGNDAANVLDGSGGKDVLFGGGGADTFVFRAGETNGDKVMDFTAAGAAGDHLEFYGFGTGATLSHAAAGLDLYTITADAAHNHVSETFQLLGVTNLDLVTGQGHDVLLFA